MKQIFFILMMVALTGFASSCHRDACPGVGQLEDQPQENTEETKVDEVV